MKQKEFIPSVKLAQLSMMDQIIMREGKLETLDKQMNANILRGTLTRTTIATIGSNHASAITVNPTPGQLFFLQSIKITCDRPSLMGLHVQQGLNTTSSYLEGTDQLHTFPMSIGDANTSWRSEEKTFTYSKPIMVYEGGGVLLAAQTVIAGQEMAVITLSCSGYSITADQYYDAKHVVMVISDSIGWRAMGNDAAGKILKGNNLYGFRLVNYLRSKDADVRLVLRGYGGSKSSHWVDSIDAGMIDMIDASIVIIALGTNDCVDQATTDTPALFKARMQYIFDEAYKRNPTAVFVICAPTTTGSSTRTSYIQNYRTAISEMVSAINNPNVIFNDGSIGIDNVDANFSRLEWTAGATYHIHLNDVGHGLYFTNLWNTAGAKMLNRVSL